MKPDSHVTVAGGVVAAVAAPPAPLLALPVPAGGAATADWLLEAAAAVTGRLASPAEVPRAVVPPAEPLAAALPEPAPRPTALAYRDDPAAPAAAVLLLLLPKAVGRDCEAEAGAAGGGAVLVCGGAAAPRGVLCPCAYACCACRLSAAVDAVVAARLACVTPAEEPTAA
jgi:hypothetical protein